MNSGRRGGDGVDKLAELSTPSTVSAPKTPTPTPTPTPTAAAVAKLHRIVHSLGAALPTTPPASTACATTSTPPEQDAQALIKSFRRKKYIRARLLLPLQSDGPAPPVKRMASPRKGIASPRHKQQPPLSVEKQSLLARLPDAEDQLAHTLNNRDEDEQPPAEDIATLQRIHALLASQDEIECWISSYETEKAQFSSFALFTEMKLDEIHDKYARLAGRPNAVEAAACCATLLKMPGIVGCYRTLIEKLAVGVQSVVYCPDKFEASDGQPMATLVRGFFNRKPFFQRAHELELQLRSARSLTDPTVLRALTVEEIRTIVSQVPVRQMSEGIVNAYAAHLPNLDHLLALVHEKKLQLQLEFYQLHGRRRPINKQCSTADGEADDEQLDDDPDYPTTVPLTSSAQICRAIAHHAAAFSSSGKEMILCSILEHIDVESFRDVFKRFDAHGKMSFLHHLSVLESSDHLQLILEQLPNAGETLFRFYYVICGGSGGSASRDQETCPKQVFFRKLLSAEMEFFFLCDLAGYLNDEQWTLLSQEYEKHALERKARRERLQQRRLTGAGGRGGSTTEGSDHKALGADEDQDEQEEDENDPRLKKQPKARAGSAGSLDQFQVLVWNYVHRYKLTSVQVWALAQAALLPSLEDAEVGFCIDYCMDRLALSHRWSKLLALVEEMEADSTSGDGVDIEHEAVRHTRVKMLRKLFEMLSREERAAWMEQTAGKDEVLTTKKPPLSSPQKDPPAVTVVQAQPPPPAKPPSLEDPKPLVARMRLDLKMLWLEALLNAVASDKESSACTALLKQTLVPFLNGQVAVVASPIIVSTASTSEPSKQQVIETLADAETAIHAIVVQLRQKSALDEITLWEKLIPASLRPRHVATTDRAVSPVPDLLLSVPAEPVPNTAAPPPWYEASGANLPVAQAFRALLEAKSESEVLEILRRGAEPASECMSLDEMEKLHGQEKEQEQEPHHEQRTGAGSFKSSLKRKLSAVVAVAEPMEWHERVKVGMLAESTQTDFPDPVFVKSAFEKATAAVVVPRAPLTLTALLGRNGNGSGNGSPKRKGDAKFQRLNNTAVPRSVAGLITSWRVNTDQLIQFAKKSMPTVLRLIGDAYGELLTAGRRKANFQAVIASGGTVSGGQRGPLKELTLAQIVYQQFLHSYGLPGIADMHLLAFSCALEAYRSQHLRVEFFSRFVFEEVSKLELGNFLEFLECLVCEDTASGSGVAGGSIASSGSGVGAGSSSSSTHGSISGPSPGLATTKRQRFVPRIVVPDKEIWVVPLEKAQEAAQLCFRAMRKQAVAAFCDKLALLAAQGATTCVPASSSTVSGLSTVSAPDNSGGGSSLAPYVLALPANAPPSAAAANDGPLLLNVDHLLQLVVDEWRDEQLRREAHLLNVFRAGDVNGDGELTSAEFTQIVRAIDHTRDLGDILLMYSETLRRTECDAIDAHSFLQVAKENELDRAAWNEDGDLRNVVNDMHELLQTWQHTRGFFVGTLEALARDLPSAHFLRNCEGAGCGCLKCILDGYIGFQRMRREFFTMTTSGGASVGSVSAASHRGTAVSEALLWARFWHLMRQLHEAASESAGILTAWDGADYMRVEPAPRPPPRYLKFRRMAVPHFLFPDTARISGVMTKQHAQPHAEAFDRDTILAQFASLMALMTVQTTSGKAGGSAQ